MIDQIRRNFTQRLTLGTLSRTLSRQPAYLGRLFHDEMGVTVHEYVTRARMEYGAEHVRSGVKIEAVALESGYQSKKNFYRQFKRCFGMTPEAYRNWHPEATVNHPAEPSRDAQNSQAGPSDPSGFTSGAARLKMAPGQISDRASRLIWPAQALTEPTLVGTSIAMLVTDDTGCYVGANDTAVFMTGYSVDELRGLPVEMLFSHLSVSDTRCRLQILLPAVSALSTNAVLRTKSAGPVHVRLMSAKNCLKMVNE
jgi:AraC-like DNA-binding protein